jgi:DNA repair protein RecO (recombination protein O)
VLRRRDSGESDARLTLLSDLEGKFEVLARGAKKQNSRLKSISEPLSVGIFTYVQGKSRKFVTQVQPDRAFPHLRKDYDRLTAAISFSEVVTEVIPFEEPSEEVFLTVIRLLNGIELAPKPLVALVWAEVQLLALTGFLPSFVACTATGSFIKFAEVFVSPSAGGYVSHDHASTFRDRIIIKAEVLYGLEAISKLNEPPKNLKFLDETLGLLGVFWEHIIENKLSARSHLMKTIYSPR